MKILVPVKSVPDYEARIKVRSDGSGIDTQGMKWVMNPFDGIAVEEAVRLRESGVAVEVVVTSIGPEQAMVQLRQALAMGADRAIFIKHVGPLDSDLAARALAAVYKRSSYDLILMGKQAVDSDCNQAPQNLAARLALPLACYASKIAMEGRSATVTREVDAGRELVRVQLPAVISVDLRLNEPRYITVPGIMKAKSKPLEQLALADLAVTPDISVRVLRLCPTPKRAKGRKVPSVAELAQVINEVLK